MQAVQFQGIYQIKPADDAQTRQVLKAMRQAGDKQPHISVGRAEMRRVFHNHYLEAPEVTESGGKTNGVPNPNRLKPTQWEVIDNAFYLFTDDDLLAPAGQDVTQLDKAMQRAETKHPDNINARFKTYQRSVRQIINAARKAGTLTTIFVPLGAQPKAAQQPEQPPLPRVASYAEAAPAQTMPAIENGIPNNAAFLADMLGDVDMTEADKTQTDEQSLWLIG